MLSLNFLCLILSQVILSTCELSNNHIKIKPFIHNPPVVDKPFVFTWDVASESCEEKFGVRLNLDYFDIVHNKNKGQLGENLVIFYSKNLKSIPYFDRITGKSFYGGLPQMADLKAILTDFESTVDEIIPDKNFHGMAVLDWEHWRALFDRMGDEFMEIYRQKSIDLIKEIHPDWTPAQQLQWARLEYDLAAERILKPLVVLGRILRPKALWGYYLYPDCRYYNMTKKDMACSEMERRRNDKIQWIFDESNALYPSVYVSESYKDKDLVINYVANRIREAMRVDESRFCNISAPVFSYHMLSYKQSSKFLDSTDLQDSIGVAAVLGGSGIMLWGGEGLGKSLEACKKLSDYIDTLLGPYCKMLSAAATRCSQLYCHSHGRCVLSQFTESMDDNYVRNERSYLSAKEAIDFVKQLPGGVIDVFQNFGYLSKQPKLSCQCYTSWKGDQCDIPIH